MEADFRVLRIMVGVIIPRVTLCSTLGYEPLAALGHSTFQVVLLRRLRVIKRGDYQPLRRCVAVFINFALIMG